MPAYPAWQPYAHRNDAPPAHPMPAAEAYSPQSSNLFVAPYPSSTTEGFPPLTTTAGSDPYAWVAPGIYLNHAIAPTPQGTDLNHPSTDVFRSFPVMGDVSGYPPHLPTFGMHQNPFLPSLYHYGSMPEPQLPPHVMPAMPAYSTTTLSAGSAPPYDLSAMPIYTEQGAQRVSPSHFFPMAASAYGAPNLEESNFVDQPVPLTDFHSTAPPASFDVPRTNSFYRNERLATILNPPAQTTPAMSIPTPAMSIPTPAMSIPAHIAAVQRQDQPHEAPPSGSDHFAKTLEDPHRSERIKQAEKQFQSYAEGVIISFDCPFKDYRSGNGTKKMKLQIFKSHLKYIHGLYWSHNRLTDMWETDATKRVWEDDRKKLANRNRSAKRKGKHERALVIASHSKVESGEVTDRTLVAEQQSERRRVLKRPLTSDEINEAEKQLDDHRGRLVSYTCWPCALTFSPLHIVEPREGYKMHLEIYHDLGYVKRPESGCVLSTEARLAELARRNTRDAESARERAEKLIRSI